MISLLADSAEVASGFRPDDEAIARFLRNRCEAGIVQARPAGRQAEVAQSIDYANAEDGDLAISADLFGRRVKYATAKDALVGVLREIIARDPARIPQLAAAVRGRARSNIARTIAEIHPDRPDLARAEEIGQGWYVGLNLSNVQKMKIIRAATAVYGLTEVDVSLSLPNAE